MCQERSDQVIHLLLALSLSCIQTLYTRKIAVRPYNGRVRPHGGSLPRIVEADGDPRGQGPVDPGQVALQPEPLLAALRVVDVVAEKDVVGRPNVHRVEEVRGRPARPVGRLQLALQMPEKEPGKTQSFSQTDDSLHALVACSLRQSRHSLAGMPAQVYALQILSGRQLM